MTETGIPRSDRGEGSEGEDRSRELIQKRGDAHIPDKEQRVNDQIRAREVRVIGENGEQLGVLSVPEALRIAGERGLDLVEVAPTAVPPVCRLLDFGRFRYEQTRKEREARRHQKTVLVKEIRLTPTTDDHDLQFKTRTIQKFLEEGDKVKVSIRFKGREMAHPQLGRQVLDDIARKLETSAVIERNALMEGRVMSMILTKATGSARKKAASSEEQLTTAQLT